LADIRPSVTCPRMAKRFPMRPYAGIMIGLSGLLLAGADCRYANVIAEQTFGQYRSAPEPTALSCVNAGLRVQGVRARMPGDGGDRRG
jgi:hypothetical protein